MTFVRIRIVSSYFRSIKGNKGPVRTNVSHSSFRISVLLRYKLQNRIGQRYIVRAMGGIKLNRQSGTFDTLISQSFPRCAMEMSMHPSPDVQESSRGVAILVVGHNGMKNNILGQLTSFVALRQGRTDCNTRKTYRVLKKHSIQSWQSKMKNVYRIQS